MVNDLDLCSHMRAKNLMTICSNIALHHSSRWTQKLNHAKSNLQRVTMCTLQMYTIATYMWHTKYEGFERFKRDLCNPQAGRPHQCKTPKHWLDIYRCPPTPLAVCKLKVCCYGSRIYIVVCNNLQHHIHCTNYTHKDK